jgi:hypothetical protein
LALARAATGTAPRHGAALPGAFRGERSSHAGLRTVSAEAAGRR